MCHHFTPLYVADADYIGGDFPITIHSMYKNVILPVIIKNDGVVEELECFQCRISWVSPDSSACGTITYDSVATICIEDTTGKSVVVMCIS